MKFLNKIQNNTITQKNFSFSKGNVSLGFNLRIDTKQDLKDFSELLKVALLEIDKEINK
jgi:hypothetical protein